MNKKNQTITAFYFLTLAVLFWRTTVYAGTIIAASCSRTDVQAAIDAAIDGDTIVIPRGTCTWDIYGTGLPAVKWGESNSNKAITLQGAGIDTTIIIIRSHFDPSGSSWNEIAIFIDDHQTKNFRITGMTFKAGADPMYGVLSLRGTNINGFRVDHIKFDGRMASGGTLDNAIHLGNPGSAGPMYGVIDHCQFLEDDASHSCTGIVLDGYNGSWREPTGLGDDKAVYIEDNVFNYNYQNHYICDAMQGGKYVLRYNQITNAYQGHHDACTPGGMRSARRFEIYDNTFTSGYRGLWAAIGLRGGTGVVFNNTFTGAGYIYNIIITNYRSCWGTPGGPNCGDPWQSRCDNVPEYICSTTLLPCTGNGDCPNGDCTTLIDGQSDSTGYPCRDQVGRGVDLASGSQAYEPVYQWNNKENGVDVLIHVHDMCSSSSPSVKDHIKANRDYYDNVVKPDYVPYTYPHPLVVDNGPLSVMNRALKVFYLEQNYPNPFNPSTAISFGLPSQSFVSLKVFDALGREVATIISEELSAGYYSRQWNAANMASGIYFYRLQARQISGGQVGVFTETKKLILLR
jgi:hypothetical protein